MTLGKLTKKEAKDFDSLLQSARNALDDAREVFGRKVKVKEWPKPKDHNLIADTCTKLAETSGALASFIDNLCDDQQSAFDERSEKWQDGDKAQAVSDWLSQWEECRSAPDEIIVDLSSIGKEDEEEGEDADEDDTVEAILDIDLYVYEDFLDNCDGLSMEAEG